MIHRTRHNKLLDSHGLLLAIHAESGKRPHTEDDAPVPEPTIVPRSDYPNIKYWTRDEWTVFESKRKDSSDPKDKAGPRGRTRCAQGHNVSMQFIEEADGRPISSTQAEDIRAFARTIWTDLYARGLALKTWGNASRKVHDEYEREMETRWPVLRYCSNHWKTHHIATKNYSQWYGRRETNETEAKAPAKKKRRTTIGDDNTGDYQTDPDSETDAVPSEAADEDSNIALPSRKGAHEGPVAGPSRPKARPLRDPL